MHMQKSNFINAHINMKLEQKQMQNSLSVQGLKQTPTNHTSKLFSGVLHNSTILSKQAYGFELAPTKLKKTPKKKPKLRSIDELSFKKHLTLGLQPKHSLVFKITKVQQNKSMS